MVKIPSTAGADIEGIEERTQLLHDLGILVALWSQFEIYIEMAIMGITKVSPLHNSILLGSLQFKAKVSILKSLLRTEGKTDTISKINTAVSFAKRNVLMHSAMSSERDFSKFGFFYRSVDDGYNVKAHTYTATDFHKHVYRFKDLANDAIDDLGLSEEMMQKYGHGAQFDGLTR